MDPTNMHSPPVRRRLKTGSPVRPDPCAIPGALAALLELFEATQSLDIDAFERVALRRLGGLVGFDGAVWGSGIVRRDPGADFSITRASVVDRPGTLLTEYAELARCDPATRRFLEAPLQPISMSVADYDRCDAAVRVGAYLRRHRIAQLLLQGSDRAAGDARSTARHWITAYREAGRRFDETDFARLQSLLPLWNQARELCLLRQLDRLGRVHLGSGAATALCDRSGLIHVAEPQFSELTRLRRGDAIAMGMLPERASRGLRNPVRGVEVRVKEAGSWLLVLATLEGAAAVLSARERQVAQYYARGLSHKQIARELGSSPSTVRTQLQCVFRRLAVHSRTELQRALDPVPPI